MKEKKGKCNHNIQGWRLDKDGGCKNCGAKTGEQCMDAYWVCSNWTPKKKKERGKVAYLCRGGPVGVFLMYEKCKFKLCPDKTQDCNKPYRIAPVEG